MSSEDKQEKRRENSSLWHYLSPRSQIRSEMTFFKAPIDFFGSALREKKEDLTDFAKNYKNWRVSWLLICAAAGAFMTLIAWALTQLIWWIY